jgi:hypothetical protein
MPFGSLQLETPEILQTLFKAVYTAIVRTPDRNRRELCRRVILAGVFPENFAEALAKNMTACLAEKPLPGDARKVIVDAAGADAIAVWLGLSIMGSLAPSVHRRPLIENGQIGIHMTASEFLQYGAEFIFSRDPQGLVLAPIGQGIGEVCYAPSLTLAGVTVSTSSTDDPASDAEVVYGLLASPTATGPASNSGWGSPAQFACIHTDASCVIAGRCGDDEPLVSIPTQLSDDYVREQLPGARPLASGAIADWQGVTQTWQTSLDYLGAAPGSGHGVVVALPIQTTRSDVERILQLAFDRLQVPTVMLANSWMAALMASGVETGLLLLAEDTMSCIVPVRRLRVMDSGIVRLPYGAGEYAAPATICAAVDAMHAAIMAAPAAEWPLLWSNILICGNCALQEDLLESLEHGVRGGYIGDRG